jgi:hypothetical protein
MLWYGTKEMIIEGIILFLLNRDKMTVLQKAISSWICSTVMLAYKSAGITLPRNQVKAHEVREIAIVTPTPNFSMSGINLGHHYLPIYQILMISENVEFLPPIF